MYEIPITDLKGVGEKTAKLLFKLNIRTIADLLSYTPREYEKMELPVKIGALAPGQVSAVYAVVQSVSPTKKVGKLAITTVKVKDDTGILSLVFYHGTYIRKLLYPGSHYVFRGKITQKGAILEMPQPVHYTKEDYLQLTKSLQPRYSLTKGLTNKSLQKLVRQILDQYSFKEFFPASVLEHLALCDRRKAFEQIHFPDSAKALQAARNRLVFEEFFFFLLLMRKNRELSIKLTNSFTFFDNTATKKLLGGLPFQLTAGQKKAWKQITEDLKSAQVMNRLIQGDVGSGKTIVATLCLIHAAGNGYQGAIMAPTEVLATQHFQTISKYNEDYELGIHPELLVGSMTASQKKAAYARIKSGESDVIIGTHALIQEKVEYKSLAMVVTDEQHRFGVRQRETLSQKGINPHILVMSATPIPRTLAIVLYGDLSVSTIRDLPGGRKPIKNCVVGTKFRPKAYEFIQKEVEAGHQAYVICPQVEEGEMDDLENVQDYAEKLKAALPPSIRVAFLHGKMKPGEKNDIMNSFAEKAIDVLVSTTVIEVGINVPNATIMMIENAERFGLAQLHQLRGRVGRGDAQSYCIFLSTKEDEKTMNRLKILNDSNDGFEIANEDLKLRGPGELFGIRQSGDLAFQIADIYADADMLTAASEEIDTLLKEDAHLRSLEHRDLLEEFNKRQASSMSLHTI